MIFSSYVFVYLFLPLVLAAVCFLQRWGPGAAIRTLILASAAFYAYWNIFFLPLLLASIAVNYVLGTYVRNQSRALLTLGIVFNLTLLFVFKYLDFAVNSVNALFLTPVEPPGLVLPLAISFFTFQQIAYLVDQFKGVVKDSPGIGEYTLFVMFFPQLIAGPIVHHAEMTPQIRRGPYVTIENLAAGLPVFVAGLCKKLIVADNAGQIADPVFAAADAGLAISFAEAWIGALAYTVQLYFDFSGYSDMAIGLARFWGIRLPVNFFSPYKSANISEFWRRWHMTLSRFLRDYLYVPLGGNRHGKMKRLRNLLVTMLLGGLWHGAGWNFLFWGGLHGVYLMVHQVYSRSWLGLRLGSKQSPPIHVLSVGITFVAVVIGWVFFRAESFSGATSLLQMMFVPDRLDLSRTISHVFGIEHHGAWVQVGSAFPNGLVDAPRWAVPFTLFGLAIAFCIPNTREILGQRAGVCLESMLPARRHVAFSYNWKWAALTALALTTATLTMGRVQSFLYFQF